MALGTKLGTADLDGEVLGCKEGTADPDGPTLGA